MDENDIITLALPRNQMRIMLAFTTFGAANVAEDSVLILASAMMISKAIADNGIESFQKMSATLNTLSKEVGA